MAEERAVTREEIAEAIQKMRFPRPGISSDEAVRRAVARFTARPDMNHCAPSVIMTLQEAYDLPGGELLPWIANGFQGGVGVGEICGALSGGAMCLSLMGYQAMEPRNDYTRRVAAVAIMPYMADLACAFHGKFGSVRCGTLTRRGERGPLETEKRMRLRLWEEHCTPFVEYVVRTMVRWGEVSQEPPPMPQPGQPPLMLD